MRWWTGFWLPLSSWLDAPRGAVAGILLVTVVSALLRIVGLTHPPERVFDEVYSPVFAWKLLRGEPYFDVHPILAQLPPVLGLSLFGDTAIGWRFGPWLWGTIFLVGLGVFAGVLTGRWRVGVLATLLAALDTAFFVYARTGLPDMFLLAVFVWGFALFFLALRVRSRAASWAALLGAGVLFGSLVAVKWFGVGALALAGAWIVLPGMGHGPWGMGHERRRLPVAVLLVALILVPVLTYLLWTIPLVGIPGVVRSAVDPTIFDRPCTVDHAPNPKLQTPTSPASWLGRVVTWHCVVWNYHATLDAQHPYASPWWSWPLLKHPVLFYLDTASDPPRRITATGNPTLWLPAFAVVWLTLVSLPFRQRRSQTIAAHSLTGDEPRGPPAEPQQRGSESDRAMRSGGGEARQDPSASIRTDLWLLLGIFGFWLPWALIQRVTFHYHYFLSFTLSLVLLALWLDRFRAHPAGRRAVPLYLALVGLNFLALYPAATALSAPWLR